MKDRVSTKILDNGAVRYGVYDETGQLLRYEYIKLEDEPDEEGTLLNKANLLTDETAAALGLASDDSTVNEAFLNLIGQLKAGVKIKVGSYVGAGTYGSSNQNTLALGFKPKLLIITPSIQKASNNNVTWFGVYIAGRSNIYGFNHRTIIAEPVFIKTLAATVTETGISWYSDSADNQMNTSGYTFYYAAIG